MFTTDEVSKFFQDKSELYEACLRNGYYLPKLKSTMVTESYMKNVLMGKTWCPKFADIHVRPCPRPPAKKILLQKLMDTVLLKGIKSVGIDDDHLPGKRWLIDVLASISAEDEIFKKSYLPPVKENKLSEIKAIELPESFLRDLPQRTKKNKKRRGLELIGAGLNEAKIQRLRARHK